MNTSIETAEQRNPLRPITLSSLATDRLPDRTQAPTTEIEQQADAFVGALLAMEARDDSSRRQAIGSIESLGSDVQKRLNRHNSAMLKAPAHLIAEAEDGGPVASNLLELQRRVAEVNPNGFDFSPGGIRKLLAWLPFVGTPLSRWYAKYQTVEAVLQDIVKNMEQGRKQLDNDNTTLLNDQSIMRGLTYRLEDYIAVGKLIESKLSAAVAGLADDEPQKAFLQEKILFPLNQRVIDLQQQLAVNQQGYLSIEVIVENNKQLIRGVDRALNVTITALGVAATLAIALKRQKKVLDATTALNDTTSDMLVQTSEQLKTQGVEIQKQAGQANIDIDKVKIAFRNVEEAINDLSAFRRDALAPMKASIEEMTALSSQMEEAIRNVESGHEVEQRFLIQLDTANSVLK